ncbi:MAG TPA: GTPase HflX [Lachnospiraceae bacterium]|nr:GTPase HflX [Lachnospiraceae bacterium]
METKVFDTAKEKEKIILIAVETSDGDAAARSLNELEELGQTAGAETVAKIIQNREKAHAGTYIGKGKIEEARKLINNTKADTVVCDDELSPAQYHNLEEALGVKVIDRTVMILDIFAKRASTSEGKLQVELAQLRYRASHLTGGRSELSRLGGGIGTRGPGEQKLEMDRRLIKERITQVRKELDRVKHVRELTRKKRHENPIPVVAIAGYTNAGKSTLLNKLTGAGVLSEDKLFATLDPVTRRLELETGGEMLFTDTVGFIRKLPHHLIQAFRGTLEEAKYADIILHVADCSNPEMDAQMHTVYDTFEKLGISDKKIVTAFNKTDLVNGDVQFKDLKADKTVKISAKNGTGLDLLVDTLAEVLKEGKKIIEKIFPYSEASKVNEIHKFGQIMEEEYRDNGIYVKAEIPSGYMYMFD